MGYVCVGISPQGVTLTHTIQPLPFTCHSHPSLVQGGKVGIPCLTLHCGVWYIWPWSIHVSCSSLVISSLGSLVKVSPLPLFSFPVQASNCHYMLCVASHDNAPFQVPSFISVCGVRVNQPCSNASSLLAFQLLLFNVRTCWNRTKTDSPN